MWGREIPRIGDAKGRRQVHLRYIQVTDKKRIYAVNTDFISENLILPERESKLKPSDSYLILKELIEKRLLAIKPDQLIAWLENLEKTGQITEQENKGLLTLAEQLDIYNVPLTEYTFLRMRTNLYIHPSLLLSFFDALMMFCVWYMQDFQGSAAGSFGPVVILGGLVL